MGIIIPEFYQTQQCRNLHCINLTKIFIKLLQAFQEKLKIWKITTPVISFHDPSFDSRSTQSLNNYLLLGLLLLKLEKRLFSFSARSTPMIWGFIFISIFGAGGLPAYCLVTFSGNCIKSKKWSRREWYIPSHPLTHYIWKQDARRCFTDTIKISSAESLGINLACINNAFLCDEKVT